MTISGNIPQTVALKQMKRPNDNNSTVTNCKSVTGMKLSDITPINTNAVTDDNSFTVTNYNSVTSMKISGNSPSNKQ